MRAGFMKQIGELETNMMKEHPLSTSWSECKNEEDRLLANTLINSRKAEVVAQPSKDKVKKKKVGWTDKLVVKAQNTSTNTSKHHQKVRLKSILKGEQEPEEQKPEVPFENIPDERRLTPQNKITNAVQVSVNNFMQTEKKPVDVVSKLNARPYSSDTKERQAQRTGVTAYGSNKMHMTFASSMGSSNPYETKGASRISSAKGRKGDLRAEGQSDPTAMRGHQHHERPISAKIADRRTKPALNRPNPLAEKLLPETYLHGGVKARRLGRGKGPGREELHR